MIIVDSNIWISHFRIHNALLTELLENGDVLLHPYVQIELALGSIPRRVETMEFLADLPQPVLADPSELQSFIERRKLYSKGIGLVDCHLLLSAILDSNCKIWTNDRRLHSMANDMSIQFNQSPAALQSS
jgi:predicted nucleic acid-binding protein